MYSKAQNRVIALAGMLQACSLVDTLATGGYLDKAAFATSVQSLLELNPGSTAETYGDIHSLSLGLDTLINILGGSRNSASRFHSRYAFGVLHLQKQLSKRRDMMQVIASRLEQARQQADHFECTHDNVIANLADLYLDTISRFRYRIHVRGDATYLQQQRVANQVRTLLFAAIRSAILWRQVGGRRWHLLTQRQNILSLAKDLRSQLKVH